MRHWSVIVLLFALSGAPGRVWGGPTELFVAPGGSDTSPGTVRKPLKTLEGARDALRRLRRDGRISQEGAVVTVRAGTYTLTRSFSLFAEDSGTPAGRILYRAAPGANVRLQGGKSVSGWRAVADPAVLARLDPPARGRVLQADLKAQGIADFGALKRRGMGVPGAVAGLELFCDEDPMPLAAWPNGDGWAATAAGAEGRFTVDTDRIARWAAAPDLWVHGYWTYDWADSYEKVAAVDVAKKELATVAPHGVYGYQPKRRYRVLNLLEELDAPGEWYLDRERGLLYFWPPSEKPGRRIVSLLEAPLIVLDNVRQVVLQGLTLEASRGAGIVVRGGERCEIAGCTVRNLGTDGIVVSGGQAHRVRSCDLYGLGESGVSVSGGDRQTLAPAEHVVENCHIHHYARWCRTYRPAIGIQGVGIRAAHNFLHDSPHNGILMGGNDHVIEYNEIARVCTSTGDAGAIYMGRNLTMRGTLIRHNHFHDIGRQIESAGGYPDVMAVYLDDCFCGTTIQGNLFVRAGRAAMIGGGRDNAIEGNVFVDCSPAIHVDQRGSGWASFWFDGRDPFLMEGLKAVPYDRPPYSTRYPHLAQILSDEPAKAKYNRIVGNLIAGKGKPIDWLDGLSEKTVETARNWIGEDPGFVDPARGDYRLRPDAPARAAGLVPIPFEKIGLYRDRFRPRSRRAPKPAAGTRPLHLRRKPLGHVLDPGQPVARIVALVAGQEAPEPDPVDILQPVVVAVPAVVAVQDAPDLRGIDIVRVPELELAHGRVEAQLEHIAHPVGVVGLGAVPDAVVPHRQRPRLADHGELPKKILVAADVGFVDPAQVAARQKHRPAHLARRVVGEVEELDIEVLARVDQRIGMPDLPLFVVRADLVESVVIVERVGADQALEDPFHLRQPEHRAQPLRLRPDRRQRLPLPEITCRDRAFVDLAHRLAVDRLRDQFGKDQQAVGDEIGHLDRCQ